MSRQYIVGTLAVCLLLGGGSAACGGRKQANTPPVVQPEAELARGMDLFRHGQFRKAQLVFQKLTFEFSVTQEELAQARYYVAECNFQLGDYVQAAAAFRKVADEFSTTEYAPTAYRPGSALFAARNSATNFRFSGLSNAAEYQPDDSTPITSSLMVLRIASSTVVMLASTATLPRRP